MGEVKIKTGKPQGTEFSRDDIIIDSTTGNIYFKDREGRLKTIVNSFTNVRLDATPNKLLGDLQVTGSIGATNTGSFAYISASGEIHADNFKSTGGDVGGITFSDDLNLTGNITASGDISSSGEVYASNIVLSPSGSITPSSNFQPIYFRNKLSGSGEGLQEWMEVGSEAIHLNLNGSPYLTIRSGSILFNGASDTIYYQYKIGGVNVHKKQKVGDHNYVYFRDRLSIGSGSDIWPTTDGTQNATPDGTLKVWGPLNVVNGHSGSLGGHITASGNISSSGQIIGIINGGSF